MSDEERAPGPGIAAEERFVYEIIWLFLGITLTSPHELRKIRGIQGTKEKTASELSADYSHQKAANRLSLSQGEA
jgi:hypothetical protein